MAQDGEMPNEERQNELISQSQSDVDGFREEIIAIINNNPDKFNVLELNKDNDGDNTIMTKESLKLLKEHSKQNF